MGNEEMGKWEDGTLHFTQQTADILLLQSSRGSQCPCMHSLRDHLCLTVGTKGYATALHHSLQANSMYKFFTFGSLHVSHFLKFGIVHTLFQLYTRSHFEASSCSCLHCYGYTYICLQWRSQAGAHWGTCPSNRRPCPTNCRRACKLSTPKVAAIVNRDRVLKIHKGLESSSADSYLYPQKLCAVRSGSVRDLLIITKSRTLPLISLHASLP